MARNSSATALGRQLQLAREAMATEFSEVDNDIVGDMLNRYGRYLKDPRMIPALQHIVDNSNGFFTSNRAAALKMMDQLAPENLEPR